MVYGRIVFDALQLHLNDTYLQIYKLDILKLVAGLDSLIQVNSTKLIASASRHVTVEDDVDDKSFP